MDYEKDDNTFVSQLTSKLQGGRKKKASKTVAKKSSKKASKKASKTSSKKGSKKASKKGSKKLSRTASKKASKKKRSKKASKKKGSKKTSKKTSRKPSRKAADASNNEINRKLVEHMDNDVSVGGTKPKKMRRSASKKTQPTQGKPARSLPTAIIAFQKIIKHIASKIDKKRQVAMKVASVARQEVMAKHPEVTDHDKIAEMAVKHFDGNSDRLVKKVEAAM